MQIKLTFLNILLNISDCVPVFIVKVNDGLELKPYIVR